MRMSEIIETFFPTNVVAVLSGPNLAIEVSRGMPTATVIGCRIQSVAEILQRELGGSRFRVYTTDELTGAELGGALKNIFASAQASAMASAGGQFEISAGHSFPCRAGSARHCDGRTTDDLLRVKRRRRSHRDVFQCA